MFQACNSTLANCMEFEAKHKLFLMYSAVSQSLMVSKEHDGLEVED